jgi:hypothetical protein
LTPDTSSGLSPELQQIANQAYFLRGKAIGADAQIEFVLADMCLQFWEWPAYRDLKGQLPVNAAARVEAATVLLRANGPLSKYGVSSTGANLSAQGSLVMIGTALALVAGKPLGIVGATWVAVRLGWCRLAPGVSWSGVCLVGLLAGIGFTMSIFISMLAFSDEELLRATKLGVLFGSLVAATLGLG